MQVVEILLDHITVQNDRSTKILDFHNPEQLKEVIDFAIPEEPLNLDQLLVDCKDTLKYQVKTGEVHKIYLLYLHNIVSADKCNCEYPLDVECHCYY